jgi:ankyrin repeat protein
MVPQGNKRKSNASSLSDRPTKAKKVVVIEKSVRAVKAKDRKELIQWVRDSGAGAIRSMLTDLLSTKSNDVAVKDEEIDEVLLLAARDGQLKNTCEILYQQLSTAGKKKYVAKQWNGVSFASPLHVAAEEGSLELVRLFIEELKFNINQMDYGGHTPLCHATPLNIRLFDAPWTSVKMIRFLLEEGADPNIVSDTKNVYGYPLHRILQRERGYTPNTELIARLLLEYGADPNLSLKYDDFPEDCRRDWLQIEHVIGRGHTTMVDVFLQHGAFLARGRPHIIVYTTEQGTVLNGFMSNFRFTPKMKRSMCRVLVKHAKSNETVAQFLRVSLLHVNDFEGCKILFNVGMNGVTSMNYAIEKENKLICQWLADLGVDPFAEGSICTKDVEQHVPSPFQVAARLEDMSILEFFLARWNERFAARGGRSDNGDYPIHLLCCDPMVSLSAIKLVAEHQAHTLTTVDGEEGLYPFHFAAMWDAELDIIYTVLRHCPEALVRG